MSFAFREFMDANQHRMHPLTDESGGIDTTDTFTLPSSLIVDIYLCAPNVPGVDRALFYIDNVLIRRQFIDISIGYDDPAVNNPIGVFRNISTSALENSTYDFIPSERQTADDFVPLYHMSGQIVIGSTDKAVALLGSWSFDQADNAHSTYIAATRVAKGILNVQYISVNEKLFTGVVKLREGSNINMDVQTEEVAGQTETTITFSASLNAGSPLQLSSDADVLDALLEDFGIPIRSINGLRPDVDRNFQLLGQDCTDVSASGAHGLTVSNPCATPCCEEDANIANLELSIANMDQRYARIAGFIQAAEQALNSLQNRMLALGTEA